MKMPYGKLKKIWKKHAPKESSQTDNSKNEGKKLNDSSVNKGIKKVKNLDSLHCEDKISCEREKRSNHPTKDQPGSSRLDELGCDRGINNSITQKNGLAVQGVYFKCPFLGPEILTKNEWRAKIKKYLEDLLKSEKSLASCLMIYTLNQCLESKKCVDTLCSVLNNIILYPKEEKYRKIRVMNKVFQDNVAKVIGACEFLESVGFHIEILTFNSEQEEYYVFSATNPDISFLKQMVDLLRNTKPISLEMYRNVKVLKPTQVVKNIQLPDDFFMRTAAEIKLEQQRRTESLENSMLLKPKEVREREKQKITNIYHYTLIRVRFPDGMCLQGTFGVNEQLGDLRSFIRESVVESVGSFSIIDALGVPLPESKDNKTLSELLLVPAVLLTFVPKKKFPVGRSYLVPELKALSS